MFAGCFVIILILYVGSYVSLTAKGQYVPEMYSSWGINSYAWAPEGMVCKETRKWSRGFNYFYYPLLHLDWKFWHTREKGFESDAAKKEIERIERLENQTGQ